MVTFLKWETRLCQLSIRRIAHFDDCKQLKLKKGHLYSGFSWELTFNALRMARVLWPVLIFPSHRGQEAELAWVAGYMYTEMVCPLEDGHPSQYQPSDSAAAGYRTHDHRVASPTLWPLDCRATGAVDVVIVCNAAHSSLRDESFDVCEFRDDRSPVGSRFRSATLKTLIRKSYDNSLVHRDYDSINDDDDHNNNNN